MDYQNLKNMCSKFSAAWNRLACLCEITWIEMFDLFMNPFNWEELHRKAENCNLTWKSAWSRISRACSCLEPTIVNQCYDHSQTTGLLIMAPPTNMGERTGWNYHASPWLIRIRTFRTRKIRKILFRTFSSLVHLFTSLFDGKRFSVKICVPFTAPKNVEWVFAKRHLSRSRNKIC